MLDQSPGLITVESGSMEADLQIRSIRLEALTTGTSQARRACHGAPPSGISTTLIAAADKERQRGVRSNSHFDSAKRPCLGAQHASILVLYYNRKARQMAIFLAIHNARTGVPKFELVCN